jgi:hypothetical protein
MPGSGAKPPAWWRRKQATLAPQPWSLCHGPPLAGTLAALLVPPDTPNYMLLQAMFAVICIIGVLAALAVIWRRR